MHRNPKRRKVRKPAESEVPRDESGTESEMTPDEHVREASEESFPASDSPGWISGGATPSGDEEERKAREERKPREKGKSGKEGTTRDERENPEERERKKEQHEA